MSAIQLTERLLSDAGGWQAMKAARALHDAGRVLEAAWDPPLLRGRVREGETEFRAGLTINSARDVTNLCTCKTSRQQGMICAHSLAAGLECLRPRRRVESSENIGGTAVAPATGQSSTLATKNGIKFSRDAGVEVAVALVLTPNLAGAISAGNVTVVPEALLPGRVPLASLATGKTYRCSAQDFQLIEQLIGNADGQLPSALSLLPADLARLLPLLVNHPRITLGRGISVVVQGEAHRLPLSVMRDPSGGLRLRVAIPPDCHLLAATGQAWLFNAPNTFLPLPAGLPAAYEALLHDTIAIPESAVAAFHAREAPLLRKFFEFDLPELAAQAESAENPEFHLKLEGSLNHLEAELDAVAGSRRSRITAPGYLPAQRAESAALGRLASCGFERSSAGNAWKLKGESRILLFFARDLPQLEREWKVSIGSRFEHVTRDLVRTAPQLNIRGSGENWFEVGVEFSAGGSERIAASEIRRLLRSGQNSTRLRNGKRAVVHEGLLDEFEQVLRDCNPEQRQPGIYRFDQRDAAYLGSLGETIGAQFSGPELFSPAKVIAGENRTAPGLGRFESILRDYQKHGVGWLHVLAGKGWAGILADEMGLGKTVQTLAFLSQLEGTSLVVCPSSLVINWQREADRFAPELCAQAVAGPDRARHVSSGARLLVTSYALLRRDAAAYRDREFAAVILDEAQHIKNPDSQAAQAAFGLRGRHRMALTGTPIENSVRDIWSIMNFLMPGYLGSRADFKERYEQPIANDPGGAEHGRLVRRLRPFILRRTKREVVKELPEKIRQVLFCELTASQRSVYSELLLAAQGVIADLTRKNPGSQRLAALTALLRLRQACLDLRLLGLADDRAEAGSAKVELLCELLDEALADGHRVLVFSQFAQMLGLIRAELAAREIACCYLDGSTRDRQSQIDQFQQGNTPVFLISLKAGGVGLNLTAADTVIHFDPWWNPAVEDQATDRAHRIGQERVVTVYQLIARGTVEEKILALQARKRQIGDLTVESDQPMMAGLQMEDLRELVADFETKIDPAGPS